VKRIAGFFRAPRPAGTMFVIGVFAGITIGGGVGVVASPTSKPVTVCVNKANFMRYAKTNKCAAGETRVAIGQTGAQGPQGEVGVAGATGPAGAIGPAGSIGATGPAGVAGPSGPAGSVGATGPAGAIGPAGSIGATGPAGAIGPIGPAGTNGVNGTAITPQSVCDGPDAGTVADEICKVGMTGPGGGLIFFVDDDDLYPTYDYLEAAPESSNTNGPFATSVALCGQTSSDNCTSWSLFPGENSARYAVDSSYQGLFRGKVATEYIVNKFSSVPQSNYAAGTAEAYLSPSFNGTRKDDWWLPSPAELQKMKENLQDAGRKYFTWTYLWSSSESSNTSAWGLDMRGDGKPVPLSKGSTYPAWPVRGF
jgi:hypothetical protein